MIKFGKFNVLDGMINILQPPKFDRRLGVMARVPSFPDDFRSYRVRLNNMAVFQPSQHPEHDEANLFSLTARHKIVDIILESPPVWVDTPESFDSMIAKTIKSKEIAIDLEFDSTHLFCDCTALFQISIPYNHFVIDPFITFSMIKDKLGPIFMNPSIVKLVFSEHVLRHYSVILVCSVEVLLMCRVCVV
jgi:hypothetical protein